MSGALWRVPALTLVYALVLGSADPWDLALGALASTGLLFAFRRYLGLRRPLPTAVILRRALAFFPYALAVAWDVTLSTWRVALIVLRLRPLRRPGIVLVPIGARTETGVAVSALANGLAPGTFVVEIDWQRRVMLVHTIDAHDPDAVRAGMQTMYERWQRHVFP